MKKIFFTTAATLLLLAGCEQERMPVYDFVTHSRTEETRLASPKRIILIDGILIFSEPELLKMMDIKIFVDTDDDVRLRRRLRRDMAERDTAVAGDPNR